VRVNCCQWGYIDKRGKLVIPGQYDSAGDFNDGIATVTLGNESITIDKMGKVIPATDKK
jgi:hypothetical protein